MLTILCKGLLIGFLVALPVGPAGALSLKRALTEGPRAGFLSGLGSTVADVLYLTLVLAGASVVSLGSRQSLALRVISAAVVAAIGLQMLAASGPASRAPERRWHANAFLSAFVLSAVNPTVLMSFALLLGGFGLAEVSRRGDAALLLIGAVFSGSSLLWLLLSRGIRRMPDGPLVYRLAGVVLISIGVAILLVAIGET